LDKKKLEAKELINSNKEKFAGKEALEILKRVNNVIAAKGKKVVDIDLRKEKIDDAILKKFILGPTGNLRAPSIISGKTLLIGFNEEAYAKVFK